MSIKLDLSRTYSECRGDRTPDDPHYRVCYWQGGQLGKEFVALPFDTNGNLVSDDGKKESWMGTDSDSKPVRFHPLWNDKMRAFLEKKEKRIAAMSARAEPEEVEDEDVGADTDEVNLQEWLRGQRKYEWALLVAACKKRYSRMYSSKAEMVTELVIDHKLVPESELSAPLAKMLPGMAA